MNGIIKRFQQLAFGVMASLVAFASLALLIPESAFAQIEGGGQPVGAVSKWQQMSIEDQARAWTSYKFVSESCSINSTGLTEESIRRGEWLGTLISNIGHHVEPDDGKIRCNNENNWFFNIMTMAGFSSLTNVSSAIFEQRDGRYWPVNDANAKLDRLIENGLFNGNTITRAPDQVVYSILMGNFTAAKACGAKTIAGPSAGGGFERTIQLKVFDPATNQVKDQWYGYNNAGRVMSVGPGLVGIGGGDPKELACDTIANELAKAKYASAVMTCLDAGTCKGLTSNAIDTPGEDPNLQCGTLRNPLNWIICPTVKIINYVVGALDNFIYGMLSIDDTKIFDRQPSNSDDVSGEVYYRAWSSFRTIALALLVAAALIMVISQALGFEFLDAYTIKKVLPRLLVAIIGISLSWELMYFFVGLTNDLGYGIRQIIYTPFSELRSDLSLGGGGTVAVAVLTSGAILALGPAGLLSFGVTALLAVGVAFLVLVLRQLVIVVLIILAPIAIACYILPNTSSAWKLWYESFTKALMMFPIIVAFLTVGRVFATVAMSGAGEDGAGAVAELTGFAAYFLPYFLIPLTFRFAGGLMRTLGGFTNDSSRGGFDRLKKYRQGKTAQNMHDMGAGNRLKGDSKFSKAFNTTTGSVNAASKTSLGMNPAKWGSRIGATKSKYGMAEAAEFSEKNMDFGVVKQNDDFLQAALKFKGDEAGMKQWLMTPAEKGGGGGYDAATAEQGIAAIRSARRATSADTFDTAAAMALPATGTAFKRREITDENGNKQLVGGAGEMHDLINEVAGDDRVKAGRMLASMRSGATQARRFDLAGGGFGNQIGELENQYKEEHAIKNDLSYDKTTRTFTPLETKRSDSGKQEALLALSQRSTNNIVRASLDGQGGQYIVGAKKSAVEAFAPVMVDILKEKEKEISDAKVNLTTVMTQVESNPVLHPDVKTRIIEGAKNRIVTAESNFDAEAAILAARYDAMSSVAPENAQVMREKVLSNTIEFSDSTTNNQPQTMTIQQLIEHKRVNSPHFVEMRREYGSATRRRSDGSLMSEAEIAEANEAARRNAEEMNGREGL